jgi:hypothetical protein
MKNILLILFVGLASPVIAQHEFVVDYVHYHEGKIDPLVIHYKTFKANFGKAFVDAQRTNIDSIANAIDRLWKNEVKKMPAHKGNSALADAMKDFFKFLRGDFIKGLRKQEDALFHAPPGNTEEELTPDQKVIFDYYRNIVVQYDNAVADYEAEKTKFENAFPEDEKLYLSAKLDEILTYFENGLPKGTENSKPFEPTTIYGRSGIFYEGTDYNYIKFDMTFSNDARSLYNNFSFLSQRMEEASGKKFYQNSYIYGGQDSYLVPEGKCPGVVSTNCLEPWNIHLAFGEGLYSGSPYMNLTIKYSKEPQAEEDSVD